MLVVTEPTTPLNNADQGGSFCFSGEMQQVDPQKDQAKVKPPKTYKDQLDCSCIHFSQRKGGRDDYPPFFVPLILR